MMARNPRILGLGFLAALALCAITAPGALAKGEFTSAKSPVVVTASQAEEGETEKFFTTAGTFECPNGTYEGTMAKSPATQITVTPKYGHCVGPFGVPTEVDPNGCDYLFTIDPTSTETKGWVDIVCPAGNDITITANRTPGGVQTIKCTIHVPPQTLGGIRYTTIEENGVKKITVDVGITGITFTHTTGTGIGACAGGGATETHTGEYKGKLKASCFEDMGSAVEEKHNGVPVSCDIGEQEEEEFTSAKSPVVVTASQAEEGETEKFFTTAGTFECPNGTYEGTMAKSPATQITVTPKYGHCVGPFGVPTEVDPNGCDYLFTIDPTSTETKGWVDIVCPAGNDITITANRTPGGVQTIKCTIHVPPQTLGGIRYTNIEENGVKKITVDVGITGITFTHTTGTGIGACAGGGATETHTGEYKGKLKASCFEDTGSAVEEKHNGVPVSCDIGEQEEEEFTSAKSPVVVTASQAEEGETEKFFTTAGTFECPNGTYEGTMAKSPATQITVTPKYGHCVGPFGVPTEVDPNGCDYLFTIDPTSTETKGWVDIVCPAGNDITITANRTPGGVQTIKCTIHVPPQTLGGIRYTNIEENGVKKITVDVGITGITFTHTTGTGIGACAGGGATETHTGEYKGKLKASCFEDTGSAVEEKHNGVPVSCDIG